MTTIEPNAQNYTASSFANAKSICPLVKATHVIGGDDGSWRMNQQKLLSGVYFVGDWKTPHFLQQHQCGEINQLLTNASFYDRVSNKEAARYLEQFFIENRISVSRRSVTSDSSILFEFIALDRNVMAFVDIFPSGNIVTQLESRDQSVVYELSISDKPLILKLLHDAGFQRNGL
jgi:hypothetical protein